MRTYFEVVEKAKRLGIAEPDNKSFDTKEYVSNHVAFHMIATTEEQKECHVCKERLLNHNFQRE